MRHGKSKKLKLANGHLFDVTLLVLFKRWQGFIWLNGLPIHDVSETWRYQCFSFAEKEFLVDSEFDVSLHVFTIRADLKKRYSSRAMLRKGEDTYYTSTLKTSREKEGENIYYTSTLFTGSRKN